MSLEWLPKRTADSWMFSHSEGIDLMITQISPTTRGLYAWVEMRWRGTVPATGLVTAARYDLMGSRTVGSMVARIKDAGIDMKTPDWRHLIQQAVYDVIQDYLSGPDPVVLASVPPTEASFVLRPVIGAVGATSFTGAGQMGKSILALACSCAVASGSDDWVGMKVMRPGPVIYVDWEADAATHATRLYALAAGVGQAPPENLHYIEAEAPLPMWASALARRVARVEAALVIIDSVMLARGGEAAAAETIAFFLALRSLNCPSLLIDHQSRDAIIKGKTDSYGSVINDNSTRLRWIMRGDRQAMTLKPVKANNFGRLPSVNLRLETTGPPERMERATWVHIDAPPPSGTVTDQVLEYVTEHPGGVSAPGIADNLDIDTSTARRMLHRLGERRLIQQIDGDWYPLDVPY